MPSTPDPQSPGEFPGEPPGGSPGEQVQSGSPLGLTFADRLDRCFRVMHPPERGEWEYQEVADGIASLGTKISTSYLWQLRKGHKDNPTLRQIEALAAFFHVPASYFLGTAEEVESIDAEIALMEAMRRPEVRELALRASTLTPSGIRAVAGLLGEVEHMKGMSTSRVKRDRKKSS